MADIRICPQCGRQLPADAPSGVCPQCLLGVGMRSKHQPHETHDRPTSFIPPKPSQLAQHFPQLEILDLVGQGGMGAVYKARQRGLDRIVALKILPPEVANDPAFEERFAREARALAKLSHPSIVGVYDSGTAGGLYYLLMEYVDGINLREAIQTNELTPAEALTIVPQICEALQYAHDEDVVHRDIKPENILLDNKGRVKIADFGLARLLRQTPDNFTLTGTDQVMGTPKYMAPEQMEGSHEVDHRADIYSLGVVFYEMLTGELPLGRFDVPSQKVKIDVRLDEIVLRTLQKEPDRRYQHASEIKSEVESISGVAQLPPHVRRMFGYEYRSKTEIFGWPLVHIAYGIDPKTGRKRIAKGIIAIGDIAVGGLACGGVSLGVFSFGGLAIGLCAIGGGALGLLMALGGGAVGLGFSVGGLAVGIVAIGGMAVGYYGLGGGAIAVHGISGAGRDPAAERFFSHWGEQIAGAGVLSAFVIPVLAIGSCLVIFAMVAISQRHATHPRPSQDDLAVDRPRRSGTGCLVVVTLFLLIGVCVIPTLLWLSYASQRTRSVRLRVEQARSEALKTNDRMRRRDAGWRSELSEDGPRITPTGNEAFHLRSDQIPQVNQVLTDVYDEYLKLERLHTRQESTELGHLVTTIEAFSQTEISILENQLWSRLDEILDVNQQREMRLQLNVHPGDGMPDQGDRGKPGILGWGRSGCRFELWKVGEWYHWKGSAIPAGEAPELPDEFKRFWNVDAESESTIDSPPAERQE